MIHLLNVLELLQPSFLNWTMLNNENTEKGTLKHEWLQKLYSVKWSLHFPSLPRLFLSLASVALKLKIKANTSIVIFFIFSWLLVFENWGQIKQNLRMFQKVPNLAQTNLNRIALSFYQYDFNGAQFVVILMMLCHYLGQIISRTVTSFEYCTEKIYL